MEIVPGIHLVPGARWSRIYLIEADETLILIDSGFPWSAKHVFQYIETIGRNIREISHVLMTHSHPDHISGAPKLLKSTDVSIVAHHKDTKKHRNGEPFLSYMGIFGMLKLPVPFLEFTPVDILIEVDGQLPLPVDIEAIHTPGHTPGSVCYLMKNNGVLFSGDTLFSNGTGLGRSLPLPGSSRTDYQDSVQRLAALEFDVLCGGHGRPLVGNASTMLRKFVAQRPNPPTWGEFLTTIPRRIARGGNSCFKGP